jgi:hypothetical protein
MDEPEFLFSLGSACLERFQHLRRQLLGAKLLRRLPRRQVELAERGVDHPLMVLEEEELAQVDRLVAQAAGIRLARDAQPVDEFRPCPKRPKTLIAQLLLPLKVGDRALAVIEQDVGDVIAPHAHGAVAHQRLV